MDGDFPQRIPERLFADQHHGQVAQHGRVELCVAFFQFGCRLIDLGHDGPVHAPCLAVQLAPCGKHGLLGACLESERALLGVVEPEQRVQGRKGNEAKSLLRDVLPEVRGNRIRRLLQCSVVENVVARASRGADEHHQQECLCTQGAHGV